MQNPKSGRYAALSKALAAGATADCGNDADEETTMELAVTRPLANEAGRFPCLWRLRFAVVLAAGMGLVALYGSSIFSNPQRSRLGTGLQVKQEAAAVADPSSTSDAMEPKGDKVMNMPIQGGQLFCWALMLPSSIEPILLAMQYAERQSLFACDQAAVYSNRTMQIGPNFISTYVFVNMECKKGGEFHTVLNKYIFDAVWKQLVDDGVYKSYTWTVKVDPDAVFFPGRLKGLVAKYTPGPEGLYLNNCPRRGLHGPLEVLSSKAVEMYVSYVSKCDTHFTQLCSGDCQWGEDMFLDQCLLRVLGVRRRNETQLLVEDHCDPPPNWRSCEDYSYVAYHPFKSTEEYQACLESSANFAGYPVDPTYSQLARDAVVEQETRLQEIKAAELVPQSDASAAYPAPTPGDLAPAPAQGGYPAPAPASAYPAPAAAYPAPSVGYPAPAPSQYAGYPAPAPGC